MDRSKVSSENAEAMSVWDHIIELRMRLIRILLVLLVGMGVGFVIAIPLIDYLKEAPPANGMAWNVFSPWDALRIYMSIAFLIGFAIALPWALYQVWQFCKPGLQVNEQRATLVYLPGSFLLFLVGISFAYFIIVPMAYRFTSLIASRMDLVETYGVVQYFSFMFNILIPVTLLFQLPIVVMFLTRLRVLNPMRMRKLRKISYFALVVIATMITPPDFVTPILVVLPLFALYELSVYLSRRIYRKQQAAKKAEEQRYKTVSD